MNRNRPALAAASAAAALLAVALPEKPRAHDGPHCPAVGQWADGATGEVLTADAAIARLAKADAILLGESHGYPDVHLWQAATGAAIAVRRGGAQYGYEMFPRASQPALDAWSAGETSKHAFLASAGWSAVWGFAANAYDPILRLPRLEAAPAIGLNVDRSLVRRVGKEGWAAVPEADRRGISDPAPAPPAYLEKLSAVMDQKATRSADAPKDSDHAGVAPKPESAEDKEKAAKALARFAEAQLVWDRAFAEAIAGGLERHPAKPVVGFMGRGHVEHGHGVAHQLNDLGVTAVASAIAVFAGEDCELATDSAGRPLADLVYGVPAPQPEPAPPPRPKIGVFIQNAPEGAGAEITRVSKDSPAEAAGFQAGDVVTEAAGKTVKTAADLGATIRRHHWGAWLPFSVKRGDETLELVAKLPKAPS